MLLHASTINTAAASHVHTLSLPILNPTVAPTQRNPHPRRLSNVNNLDVEIHQREEAQLKLSHVGIAKSQTFGCIHRVDRF